MRRLAVRDRAGSLFLAGLAVLGATSLAWAEEITFTTYYPASQNPNTEHGYFKSLRVGDSGYKSMTPPPPDVGVALIQKTLGIGTKDPVANLDIQSVSAPSGGNPFGTDPWFRAGDGNDSGRVWMQFGDSGTGTGEPGAPFLVLSDQDDPPWILFQQIGGNVNRSESNPRYVSWIGQAESTSPDIAIMGYDYQDNLANKLLDRPLKVGIGIRRIGIDLSGTIIPLQSRLNVYEAGESTTIDYFKKGLSRAGINIVTDYSNGAYTPGIFWSTQNEHPTKPKAGIFLQETAKGTAMYFGTSNDFATGITNDAMVITPSGNVGIGTTTPTPEATLEVNGKIKITGGSPGLNKVLTSDAKGLAFWDAAPGKIIAPEFERPMILAGHVPRPKESKNIAVTFSRSFAKPPIVTCSGIDGPPEYDGVKGVTKDGFVCDLGGELNGTTGAYWIAIGEAP